jgi:hypothetical protein
VANLATEFGVAAVALDGGEGGIFESVQQSRMGKQEHTKLGDTVAGDDGGEDGVILEVGLEGPHIGGDLLLAADEAPSEDTAVVVDMGDPVDHAHSLGDTIDLRLGGLGGGAEAALVIGPVEGLQLLLFVGGLGGVAEVGEPVLQLVAIEGQTASVLVDYMVSTESGGKLTYYQVQEYFRVRYTTERMYLLDYEKQM